MEGEDDGTPEKLPLAVLDAILALGEEIDAEVVVLNEGDRLTAGGKEVVAGT
jgi:hypothetical protein